MNLRDLHYFIVLADLKHFGEAAKKCYVSQPTLSMQIKKLEETLGVHLFERTNKNVFLTDQGTALLARAKKIMMLVDEMKDLARNSTDPFSGDLRLGVIPTVAPYLLPLIMPELKSKYPDLKIWLIEDQTHRLINKLDNGEIDAAIMAQPVEGSFSRLNLFEEDFYFACAASSPLAGFEKVTIDVLATQPVMLLKEGHCLREQAMAVCQMAKVNDVADFTATSLETLRLMVQSGMGVTLLPALAARMHSSSLLKCIPFDSPVPSRTLALFWRSGTPKIKCLNSVGEHILQITQKLLV
ncbi:LysR substrate-binding domain-containing protein [uncultured Legionella sp.]|uniref:LysR substrate-binding domain-containing protein n=1 Tax=uncultured Legionella sp. TaxID=210934 RepID=UPI002609DE0D|nr:LysR substrate-binding domain-containing protein [uncultured Legionella sp.]